MIQSIRIAVLLGFAVAFVGGCERDAATGEDAGRQAGPEATAAAGAPPAPEPNPSHVRRFRKSAFAGDGRETGTQTFIDEELQRAMGRSSRAVSLVMTGCRVRQTGSRRGLPRRGYAWA